MSSFVHLAVQLRKLFCCLTFGPFCSQPTFKGVRLNAVKQIRWIELQVGRQGGGNGSMGIGIGDWECGNGNMGMELRKQRQEAQEARGSVSDSVSEGVSPLRNREGEREGGPPTGHVRVGPPPPDIRSILLQTWGC